ncbi:MAG: sugar ABC transporter permease [Clostridiales bacterium]|nr:sugar ABC transporter permease [Clostridiales bacterium]
MRSKKKKLNRSEELWAWLFVLPATLLLFGFLLIPLVVSFVMSFMQWNIVAAPSFNGLDNLREIFSDGVFLKSIGNTFFMMIGIPIGMFLSFLLAVALNRNMPLSGFFKVVYYLPAVTSGVAVAVVWKWIFNQEYGILNKLIGLFGVEDLPNWLGDVRFIKPAFILMGIWAGLGNTMLLFLASLRNIDQSYYEAAELDGASAAVKMFRISLPLVSPVTFYILVMGLIGGLQAFGQVYVMTPGGGLDNSAMTMVYYIWQKGIEGERMGLASAAAWVLALFTFAITFIQFIVRKYWVKEIE